MGTDWAPPPAKSEGLPSAEALVPADAQRASQRADFEAALAAAEPESEPEPPSGSPEPWAANMRVGSMTFALDDDVQMIPGAPTGDEPDGQHNSNAPNRGEDVCYHCKKLGHWKRECPLLRNSQQAYTKPKKPTSHMRRTSTEQWQHEVSGPAMRVFVGNKASAHQLAPEVYREYRKVAASTRHLRKTSGGNGPLHVQHFKQLTHHLGANLSRTEIRAELATLDPESTGSVPLAALDQWWYSHKLERQRLSRQDAKFHFDSFDTDNSNSLDKGEFLRMMRKHSHKLGLGDTNIQVLDDWPKVNIDGRITFPAFEVWWKKKIGLVSNTTDVLPEYLKLRMEEEMYQIRKREVTKLVARNEHRGIEADGSMRSVAGKRDGKDLWELVRTKWSLIRRMTSVWGNLNDVYDTNFTSVYDKRPVPPAAPGILTPESRFTSIWDFLQVFLLLYVTVNLPLVTAFKITYDSMWSFRFLLDLFIDIYFVIDVVVNFRTAYIDQHGNLEGRPSKIAIHCMQRWFAVDLISVLPIQYYQAIVEEKTVGAETDVNSQRTLKVLRLLRMSKMLRAAKIRKLVKKYSDVKTAQWLPAILMFLTIIVLCHLLACIFYYAGDNTHDLPNGNTIHGWVYREESWYRKGFYNMNTTCIKQPKCLAGLDAEILTVPLTVRYSTALNYVFDPFDHGHTGDEKMIGVLAELLMGLIYGMMAALFSSILMVWGSSEAEMQGNIVVLKQWMTKHRLPKAFQHSALEYFNRVWAERMPKDLEQEMAVALPPDMTSYMIHHMYGTKIENVPIFKKLSTELINELCKLVVPQLCLVGEPARL